ncbi:hypothetical protein V8E53_007016 [Lactarius tabidus]
MIGDFNDNANAMWSLHLGEAKSHDEARIHSLKDDMDGVLIFAGLFSAALTSFLIDSVSNLQVDPAQQMVFYQQQNVALLAQISHQISAIASQDSIPLTPLPSYSFSPSASDIRVNAFWFMSLVFSLTAALLATLVQQWVRDYMHVFQRYSNPLKSARLRQYLYEGVEGWYMPRVARAVPGLVHISLFLFFAGLVDSLLATYTTVGVTTIIPIAICSSSYVFSTFAPVINPQSPFRNPFSGLIWYLKQKVHPRRYLDRASGGSLKAVSSNLSEGQMQLAMEEGDGRKDRDVRAIRWLIHNRTEDDEMESFVMAIPGAFTSKWGINVWRKAAEVEDTELGPDEPTTWLQNLAVYDLCKRVRHLAGTCDNYSIFINKELWLRRARGCVETAASLVFCADIKPELFGDLEKLLIPLHDASEGRHTAPGSDGLFVARLDSLSFVIAHRGMENHDGIKLDAQAAIKALSRDNDIDENDENALRNARTIDQHFENAMQFCLYGLRETLRPDDVETTEEQAKEALARDHEDDISMLEHVASATDRVLDIDRATFSICDFTSDFASGLMSRVSGSNFDDFEETELFEPTRFFGLTDVVPVFLPQLIFLHQRLRLLCSYSSKLRDIVNGQGDSAYQETLESLGTLWGESDNSSWSGICYGHLMERQLWRLQDLRDGGGFGYWVEFCLLVVQQLLLIPLSIDAQSSLLLGMFRAAASNWRQHKHSIGTQRVILNVICDIAIPDRGLMSDHDFPTYITDELLALVENIVEGQSGSHIDEAMKELEDAIGEQDEDEGEADITLFRAEAVKVISRSRAPAPPSSSS